VTCDNLAFFDPISPADHAVDLLLRRLVAVVRAEDIAANALHATDADALVGPVIGFQDQTSTWSW
jgi:hypothetical protein